MDVRDRLSQISKVAEDRVVVLPIAEIERRAIARRRTNRIWGSVASLVVVATLVVGANHLRTPPTEREVATGAPGTQFGDEAASGPASIAGCDADDCGEGRPLADGREWLGRVLDLAGLEYDNQYRSDGGGGHLVPQWEMFISVLPPRSDPAAWALSHEYEPLWQTQGLTVYISGEKRDQIGYLYWQAGGVDSLVQVSWSSSVSRPQDLRSVVDRIIAEQQQNEYEDGR